MAKEEVKEAKKSLRDKLLKNSTTKYTSVLTDSLMFKDKDVIPTDVPIINVAFSGELDGGLCSGLTLLAGPSRSFKSNLALICIRAFLNKYPEAVCLFYDSEGGITPDYLISLNIDTDRVVHIPIENLEMLKFDIVKQLQELDRDDKVIILIDSIGSTASQKELEDALGEKTVSEMQRAKTLKSVFRMITAPLVIKDIPCIAICHTYQEMTLYPKQIISGGTGLMYSANQAFIISKSQEKEGTETIGYNFTLNVEKSRFVREKSKIPFTVTFNEGVHTFSGLLEIALESKHVIKPSNGWYCRVDDDGVVEDKKWRIKDTDTKEFWQPILRKKSFCDFVKGKYQLSSNSIIQNKDILDEMSQLTYGDEE